MSKQFDFKQFSLALLEPIHQIVYPSAKVLSVYFTAPANWANRYTWGSYTDCTSAEGYSNAPPQLTGPEYSQYESNYSTFSYGQTELFNLGIS